MTEVQEVADDVVSEKTDGDRIHELADELRDLDDVRAVEVREDRMPTRLRVALDVANVTDAVNDRLDRYGARVENDSLAVAADGTLGFEVTTPERFKPAGARDIRPYGDSTAFTFTRESLDLSEFTEREKVDVHARDGAVLLVEHGE